jgi:hypothetical protein
MKNYFLLVALISFSFIGFSQESTNTEDNFGRNEIKINALYLVLEALEISYERNTSKNTSLGVSVFVPFKKYEFYDNIHYSYSFMANPYFRVFFGKKPAQGFFVEANAALTSLQVYYYDSLYNPNGYFLGRTRRETEFGFGLGIAAGGKFVLNDKFVAEIYGGLGRYLNQDSLGYPRLGINLGYRFN